MSSSSEAENSSPLPPGFDLYPGQLVLNTWQVIEPIGRGAMGAVYRVYHRQLGREMAMKTLRSDRVTEVTWKRFLIEGKAIAKLLHPNIIQIFDMGTSEDGYAFYTMELLDGQGLDHWIRHQPLTVMQTLYVFRQVASALAFAHDCGILHRDIKPANIVISFPEAGKPPLVKVVDFGLAKLSGDLQSLTQTGEVCGSPIYMSPEQACGQKVDLRSDIYSLGCALYESLTGFPPFIGKSATKTMLMHVEVIPKAIEVACPEKEFPVGLSPLVQKMLAKSPNERYRSASQVAQDLALIEKGLGEKVLKRLCAEGESGESLGLIQPVASGSSQIEPRNGSGSRAEVAGRSDTGAIDIEDDVDVDVDVDEQAEIAQVLSGPLKPGAWLKGVILVSGLFCLVLGAVFFKNMLPISPLAANLLVGRPALTELQLFKFTKTYRLSASELESLSKPVNPRFKYFLFPQESIGEIVVDGQGVPIQASGLREFAATSQLSFTGNNYLLDNEKLWEKFGSDDFCRFSFSEVDIYGTSADHDLELARSYCAMLNIGRLLPGLSGLDLTGIRVSRADWLQLVKQCTSLEELRFRFAPALLAEDLTCLPHLMRLRILELPSLADSVTPLLEKLAKGSQLEELVLRRANLTEEDFRYLADMRKLKRICLQNCNITEGCFRLLGRQLELIDLTDSTCSSESIGALCLLPRLRQVIISQDIGSSTQELDRLRKCLSSHGGRIVLNGSALGDGNSFTPNRNKEHTLELLNRAEEVRDLIER